MFYGFDTSELSDTMLKWRGVNMAVVNRQYKDRLFCFIFGREENKAWTLDLYNAMNDSHFDNPDDIQLFSIENFLYIGMKNDVSFIVQDVLSSYEQQSTYNPNMPIRQLIYIVKLYEKYIHKNKLDLYGKTKILLPKPKLAVFYNGLEDEKDTILKLSDSFISNDENIEADISVQVKMLNINYGDNKEILEKCKPLKEYSWFIDRVRFYCRDYDIMEAADRALSDMDDSAIIKPFLMIHKAEVLDMLFTAESQEWMLEVAKESAAKIGREEGFAKGLTEGREEGSDRINRLNDLLINDGRMEDLKRAIKDRDFQEKLIEEYNV